MLFIDKLISLHGHTVLFILCLQVFIIFMKFYFCLTLCCEINIKIGHEFLDIYYMYCKLTNIQTNNKLYTNAVHYSLKLNPNSIGVKYSLIVFGVEGRGGAMYTMSLF